MAEQSFEFRFMLLSNRATLDDIYLTVKQGARTYRAEVSRLKHLYVIQHPDVGLECLIAYDTPEGKAKRIRFNANDGEPQFDGLVESLVKLRPEIDIRNMSLKDAHKLMGAPNLVKLAPLIVCLVAVVVLGVIFMPALVHGFDSGSATVDAETCTASCPAGSRNVSLTNGYLNGDDGQYVEEYEETGSTTRTTRYFFPYVPYDWEPSDPIFIIVEIPAASDSEVERVFSMETIPTVRRDVLWEGLDGETRRVFEDEVGVTLAPEARLYQYKADTHTDLIVAVIIGGAVLLICGIASIIVMRRYR